MTDMAYFAAQLDYRRRLLGMSYSMLARRSGLSARTVRRLLQENHSIDLSCAMSVTTAMGMSLEWQAIDAKCFLEQQALEKAECIARMVQANHALESQAVDHATYRSLVEKTRAELLAGSRQKLWAS